MAKYLELNLTCGRLAQRADNSVAAKAPTPNQDYGRHPDNQDSRANPRDDEPVFLPVRWLRIRQSGYWMNEQQPPFCESQK